MKLRPWLFLLCYLLLILIYAVGYLCIPDAVKGPVGFTLLKSIYFSAVTITTLGYGDFSPNPDSNLALLVVASEPIMGVVIIGLFLNSIWQSFINRIEAQQDELIKKRISQQNLNNLTSFYKYLKTIIDEFRDSLYDLTNPLMKKWRSKQQLKLSSNFTISDLQDMYEESSSRNAIFNKKSVIQQYFDMLDLLLNELRFLMSNFDLNEYPYIRDGIILFLWSSRGLIGVRENLDACQKEGLLAELFKQQWPDDPEELKERQDQLFDELEANPEISKVSSQHAALSIITLYSIAQSQIEVVEIMEKKFKNLMSATEQEK